jgi:hypothetical protein
MAAGRRKHAEAIYAEISPNSIVKKMPKAHVCANFLPDGVCTHGVNTRGEDVQLLRGAEQDAPADAFRGEHV